MMYALTCIAGWETVVQVASSRCKIVKGQITTMHMMNHAT
jgi:hypothetical protein